ncbi:SIMPL domain-containing protein [Oceanobacillus luteolus]|uniref:SIMPL domain-containing protein n=1 Tax=Oceanobacillus luteolus TaxID=1274358 RepID=A0ABW4HQ42_9BACI|nr:SIMPL domain-containing protein [Oceanobacillus luteolus]MCM3740392.1 SIMPL domain-containing protein [Oceanobacillus luteolus]
MYYPYVPQQVYRQPERRRMTVTGEGSVSAQPDTVSIQLGVRTESESVLQAEQENASVMNQVIDALIGTGIPRENIKTASFTISPLYDFVEGEQVFRGYQVINSITVELNDVSKAGLVIDTAVQNGVNQVSSLQFSLQNPEIYYNDALDKALKNAISKATSIAQSLQVNLDPTPVKITEQVAELQPRFQTFAALESTTPIEPGQLKIRATVKAIFQY